MHLETLMLSHFRSHKLTRLEVDERPVAIYGPNGSGKTNLIEAVSLFSPGRGLRRASAAEMARRPEALGWKVAGRVCGRAIHDVSFTSENGAARRVEIDGKPASQVQLGELARVVWLVPAMDRLWIEGSEGRRRFLDRTVLSFYPDHAQSVLDYEKAMRERNRLLKDQVRDAHWYTALEAQMARAGAAIAQNRIAAVDRLTEAQRDADTQFPTADLVLSYADGGQIVSEPELREAFAKSRSKDMAAGRTLIGPHRTDLQGHFASKDMPAADCSTGEQKALLISLILANARALAQDQGTPPLVLLDEVAAHLDADRRAALYDEITALEAQAWLTGTGPELFAELGNRARRLQVTETNGVSEIDK